MDSRNFDLDLLVIGSGPHNLTLVSFLLEADPTWKDRFRVVDPSGKWLTQWDKQMGSQEIVHLRSSSVHHPDPNPMALRTFAKGRFDEFYPPYYLPSTELFREFCQNIIENRQLNDLVFSDRVVRLVPIESSGFLVELLSGKSLKVKSVVFALGGGSKSLPEFAFPHYTETSRDLIAHSDDVDLRTLEKGNSSILIVGAGLTAGHLALGALKRGHRVTLLARRKISYKLFDAAPGWIGPKFMTGFHKERRWTRRRKMILKARGGGAMTQEIRDLLEPYARSGQLSLKSNCTVKKLDLVSVEGRNQWRVDCGLGRKMNVDRVWLCTGTQLDLRKVDFLQEVWKNHPVEMVQGLPILEEKCQWPGLPLYVMGIPAALRVGPVARNLPGARASASRIVEALTGKYVAPN